MKKLNLSLILALLLLATACGKRSGNINTKLPELSGTTTSQNTTTPVVAVITTPSSTPEAAPIDQIDVKVTPEGLVVVTTPAEIAETVNQIIEDVPEVNVVKEVVYEGIVQPVENYVDQTEIENVVSGGTKPVEVVTEVKPVEVITVTKPVETIIEAKPVEVIPVTKPVETVVETKPIEVAPIAKADEIETQIPKDDDLDNISDEKTEVVVEKYKKHAKTYLYKLCERIKSRIKLLEKQQAEWLKKKNKNSAKHIEKIKLEIEVLKKLINKIERWLK